MARSSPLPNAAIDTADLQSLGGKFWRALPNNWRPLASAFLIPRYNRLHPAHRRAACCGIAAASLVPAPPTTPFGILSLDRLQHARVDDDGIEN